MALLISLSWLKDRKRSGKENVSLRVTGGSLLSRNSIFILGLLLLPSFSNAQAGAEAKLAVDAIFNGELVTKDQPISKAIIRISKRDGYVTCTGVLISDSVFLTAGHCVRSGFVAPGTKVQSFAQPDLDCSRGVVTETSFIPGAEPDGVLMLPDIAIVRIGSSLCGVVPAEFSEKYEIVPGSVLTTAGFGTGTANPANAPDQTTLKFLPENKEAILALYEGANDAWKKAVGKAYDKYFSFYKISLPENEFASVCGGDSGGPVFRELDGKVLLYGLNGAIYPHPDKGLPSCDNAFLQFVSPLSGHAAWIESKLKEWK